MRYENVCIEALRYELPSQSLQTSAIEGALSGLYGRMGIRPGWLPRGPRVGNRHAHRQIWLSELGIAVP